MRPDTGGFDAVTEGRPPRRVRRDGAGGSRISAQTVADGPPLPRSEAEEGRGTSKTLASVFFFLCVCVCVSQAHGGSPRAGGRALESRRRSPPPKKKRCLGLGVAAAAPRPDSRRPSVRAGVGSRGGAQLVGDGGLGLGRGDGTAGLGCRDSGGPPSSPKGGWWLVVPMK